MFDKPRKFLIDEMLGRLSRWLRMLGYDTTFAKDYQGGIDRSVSDKKLIQLCLNEKRTMISRDKDLILSYKSKFRRKYKREDGINLNTPCLYLKSQVLMDQLKGIYKKFKINLIYDINRSRCPKCNFEIRAILDTRNYQKLIPENVFAYHNEFWKCSNENCGKIYWKGTHIDDISSKLENLKKELHFDSAL